MSESIILKTNRPSYSTNSMCRIQARISQGLELLQFFTTRKWDFRTEQFYAVGKELSDRDLEMYGDAEFFLKINVLMHLVSASTRLWMILTCSNT